MLSLEVWFIVAVLVTSTIINVSLLRTKGLQKERKATISLFSTSIVTSTSVNLYSHYSFEPLSIINHTLFKTTYILSMLVIVQGNILTILSPLYQIVEVNVFDQLNYLLTKINLATANFLYQIVEVNVFDQLNYLLARISIKTSNMLKRIQTGNLNINMLMVFAFFLLCLVFLSLSS